MYIKREPLGRGRLTFRARRRRYPILLIALYLAFLAAALIVLLRKDQLQPQVMAMIGPEPTPTPSAGELTALGEEAYARGDLQAAADYYRLAWQLTPNDVQIMFDLARFLTLTQDPANLEEALAVANQAILTAPEDPRGFAAKARVLNWMGNAQDSAVEALRAIELDQGYALGHAYLAEAYTDLARLRPALDEAELAIQLDPYSIDARRNYAYVLEHYGDYNGAVQQYLQALQLNNNLLDLWYGLARNYRGAGMIDEAVAAYQQIIVRTGGKDPQPYTELGRTYFEIRDDDAAQQNLERAVELVCADCPRYSYRDLEQSGFQIDPERLPEEINISAWRRLGNVYHTRRNFEDAIAIFEELIAWCKAHNVEVPIDAYFVSAAGYYYLDHSADGAPLCNRAIPYAEEALDIYERKRIEDPGNLLSILSVFVLCRDYALTPPTISFQFPVGYEEPNVLVQRPGTGSNETPTPQP